MKYNKVNVLLI